MQVIIHIHSFKSTIKFVIMTSSFWIFRILFRNFVVLYRYILKFLYVCLFFFKDRTLRANVQNNYRFRHGGKLLVCYFWNEIKLWYTVSNEVTIYFRNILIRSFTSERVAQKRNTRLAVDILKHFNKHKPAEKPH